MLPVYNTVFSLLYTLQHIHHKTSVSIIIILLTHVTHFTLSSTSLPSDNHRSTLYIYVFIFCFGSSINFLFNII